MPKTQREEQPKNQDRPSREALNALIEEQIIHSLGRPGDLLKVGIRPLWDNKYRVNVFIGKDAATATVANSYFLAVDPEGQITTCSPNIVRRYEVP